ncbi:hypothetical protein [Pedobacter sp. NJ-S-72]
MLYHYKSVKHDFQKFHTYIEHLVLKVWCNPTGNYSISKLHPDFIPIVEGLNPKYLKKPIHEIYKICKNLTAAQRGLLINGFNNNNSIEDLCKGIGTPLLYGQIGLFSIPLQRKLNLFFKNIYSIVPQRSPFKVVCGNLDDYYDDLVGLNEKCPFCGIADILGSGHSKRDALDHYLPKDSYPFNSVNPNNLAPICRTCNESYKGVSSPIQDSSGTKRKAFYPFASKSYKLKIKVDL